MYKNILAWHCAAVVLFGGLPLAPLETPVFVFLAFTPNYSSHSVAKAQKCIHFDYTQTKECIIGYLHKHF